MAVSLALLGLGSKYLDWCEDEKPIWAVVFCVVTVCADVSFFSIGLGPITWRAQGSSLAISVNRLVRMFLGLSGVMVMATTFFYCYLPETKGKTLEEIGVLFEDQDDEHRRLIVS
ncbi:unnamed protein product [Linum tenue]|uniref:Uncharacterized protein n=1 Tax=Linum tenue TaxID=586396 RepID=A0AAV0HYA7_9ROSI|nr:unnamed protein product [Linum tenue]